MGQVFRVMGFGVALLSLAACASGQQAGGEADGRKIFLDQCYGCHTLGAAGTPIAPDLSHIGGRLTRDEIERRLRDPRTHKPAARMPKIELSDVEIEALASYLSGLR
jgi:cytochrome c oxidase subunit 2